jgi:hypothetical protein
MSPRQPVRVEVINPPPAESIAQAREALASLGREIETAEREGAQLEGALEQIKQQFQTEFNLQDIKSVRKRLIQLQREIASKQIELVSKVEVLRRDFEW